MSAGVAQPVEQLICNQQVGGSNPSTSSIKRVFSMFVMYMGVFPSGQRGQTVNLLRFASVVRIHPRPPNQCTAHNIFKSGALGITRARLVLYLLYTVNQSGALAQLGAHHTGSVGVRGSNPLCSTSRASPAPSTSRTLLRDDFFMLEYGEIFFVKVRQFNKLSLQSKESLLNAKTSVCVALRLDEQQEVA